MKKGTLSFNQGLLIGIAIFGVLVVFIGYGAWKTGLIQGMTAGIGGELGKYKQVSYGSALINNYPEGLYCYDQGSKQILFNYTAINSTDKDFGRGFLTITADGGALAYITVTAKPNNTDVLSVKEASSNEKFEDADYENWPVPPDYLEEDESVTYEYLPTIKSANWDRDLPVNRSAVLRIHVDIPEAGEPIPGCNRDVGDGVCEKDIVVTFKHQGWGDSFASNTTTTQLGQNITANTFAAGDGTNTRYCSVNETCVFSRGTTDGIGWGSDCY